MCLREPRLISLFAAVGVMASSTGHFRQRFAVIKDVNNATTAEQPHGSVFSVIVLGLATA
jgi:hypothetical protein